MKDSPVSENSTASRHVVDFALSLAERSEALTRGIESKLSPITTPTEEEVSASPEMGCNYPPLFSELQDKLQRIALALDEIESTIARAEV